MGADGEEAETVPPVRAPLPLLVAAALVGAEAVALVAFAVLDLGALSSGRIAQGVGTSLFLLAYAGLQAVAAVGLVRLRSWARGPVLFTQLVQLGLAWNLRAADLAWLSPTLAVVALAVVAGVLLPASLRAFESADDPTAARPRDDTDH